MRRHLHNATLSCLSVLIAAACLAACGSKNKDSDAVGAQARQGHERARLHNDDVDLFQTQPVGLDVNGDGRPDIFEYSYNGVVRVVRYDLDFDGEIDAVLYYGSGGELQQQEFYLDNDDLVDTIRLFEAGTLAEKRMAIDFDQNFPLTKFYDSHGDLLRVEQDTNGSGMVDMWSYYQDGRLVRVARDTDGDGTPDSVSEIE